MELAHASPADIELRPHAIAFIAPWFARTALALLAITVLVALLGLSLDPAAALIAAPVFLGAMGALVYAGRVRIEKERYTFLPERLRCRSGGLLSERLTELEVRNITHVKLRLPWLRYKLLRVGDVLVESAGSGGSEIAMRSVRDPEAVYGQLRELMQKNGFRLRQDELLHEEKPAIIGVITETFGIAFGAAVGVAYTLGGLIAAISTDAEYAWVAVSVTGSLALVTFARLVVHFLDLRRRTYRVYEDTIVYEEGFLTRDNAFIPAENLSDSGTTRSLLDRILGLYNVNISCQGSGSEIRFRRLARGAELAEVVDRLVDGFGDLAGSRTDEAPASSETKATHDEPAKVDSSARPDATEPPRASTRAHWTADLRMNTWRALVPYVAACVLMIPGIPFWIFGMVEAAIRASATRYSVRSGSIKSRFTFITSNEREFTNDKITGLVVKEGPFDRLLSTVQLQLWSIGSARPLDLKHIKRDTLDLPALLSQLGMPESEPTVTVSASFSLGAMLRGHLFSSMLLMLTMVASMLLAALVDRWFVLGAVLVWAAWVVATARATLYAKRQRLRFGRTRIEAHRGILWREHIYAQLSNVKKLELTRFPGGDVGRVRFFVAGERRIGQQQNGLLSLADPKSAQRGMIPYQFTLEYIDHIEANTRSFSELLEGRSASPDLAQSSAVLMESRPALSNSMTLAVLVSVLLTPLVALLPLTLPFIALVLRRRQYRIEAERVVYTSGVLYRTHTSIAFNRIDAIRHEQGALNKLFKNGNVILLTAGSSKPDLVLRDLPDYEAFYGRIPYGRPA